jgi:hypothetical protein
MNLITVWFGNFKIVTAKIEMRAAAASGQCRVRVGIKSVALRTPVPITMKSA